VTANDSGQRAARSLAELLVDPGALRSPKAVIPRSAWPGRVSMLAAGEKVGKTTFACAALGAASRGDAHLGETCAAVPVLYASLPTEGHPLDVVRTLARFRAAGDRTWLIVEWAGDPLRQIRRAVTETGSRVVVIDSLAALALAAGGMPESGDAAVWGRLLAPVLALARETDVAVVLLHHARRSDGRYRDSSAIGASVDAIIEMSEVEGDPAARRIRTRARWHVPEHTVRLIGDEYVLGGGEVSLDARILAHVVAHPGASSEGVRAELGARRDDVTAALRRLSDAHAIEDRGSRKRREWYPASGQGARSSGGLGGQNGRADLFGPAADGVSTDGAGSGGLGADCGAGAENPTARPDIFRPPVQGVGVRSTPPAGADMSALGRESAHESGRTDNVQGWAEVLDATAGGEA
jgi:AAA domain